MADDLRLWQTSSCYLVGCSMESARVYSVLAHLLPPPPQPSGLKQLRWEAERDDWLHNRDVKSIIKRKKNFKKRRPKITQKIKKQRKWVFLSKLKFYLLIFAVQPFFLILLSDSVHPRLFNGFVINYK